MPGRCPRRSYGRSLGLAIACVVALLVASRALPVDDSAGSVRFVKAADSRFDRYTRAPSAAEQEWMRRHYWRMRCYAPYFDTRLGWFPRAWVYKNLYGVPVDAPLVRESDGAGRAVPPRDTRTGAAMAEPDWQRYVAEFTEQIRAAFPGREIVH